MVSCGRARYQVQWMKYKSFHDGFKKVKDDWFGGFEKR